MIELFEGVPGSGKSYYAVADKFLPAVRAGRRIYIYVDGIYLDRLARFTGIDQTELEQQITVWKDPLDVLTMHETVEPQSLVMIDEAQTVFRSLERVDKRLLRWLETHRHYGVDVLLCCQDYKQMSSGVTRLVESTIEFKRLAVFGLQRHAQARVRGNPDDDRMQLIRKFPVKYQPTLYAYYSSYALAAITEEKRAHHVFKSARVVLGIAASLFVVAIMLWKPWTSLGSAGGPGPAPKPAGPINPIKPSSPAGSFGLSVPGSLTSPAPPAPATPTQPVVRIVGTFAVEEDDPTKQVWRYVLSTGEALTATEIAGRYGLTVSEARGPGFPRLLGEGVVYESSRD